MYQRKNKKYARRKRKEINLRFVGKTGNFGAFFPANGSVAHHLESNHSVSIYVFLTHWRPTQLPENCPGVNYSSLSTNRTVSVAPSSTLNLSVSGHLSMLHTCTNSISFSDQLLDNARTHKRRHLVLYTCAGFFQKFLRCHLCFFSKTSQTTLPEFKFFRSVSKHFVVRYSKNSCWSDKKVFEEDFTSDQLGWPSKIKLKV